MKPTEIYISVRIESLRNTVEQVQGAAMPEDIEARNKILEALTSKGFKLVATGEGKYADAWVTLPRNHAPREQGDSL